MKKKLASLFSVLLVCCVLFTAVPAQAASFPVDFDTSCAAIALVNLDTGTTVYQKNADTRREPASLTKIMTYIIVSEHVKDLQGTRVTVSKEVVDRLLGTGSSMSNIRVGNVLTVYQLLNCMMVPSGNDAALVLADYVGNGSVDKFVELMNEKAKALGCKGTRFANPHGLHNDQHYTTANDLVKITRCAMSLPYFMQICSQTRYTYKPVGGPDAGKQMPTLSTTNLLIDKNALGGKYFYTYAKGIKTGHTDEAGYCLISTASAYGYTYLCVALGAPSVDANGKAVTARGEMLDSAALYRWALTKLELKKIVGTDQSLGEVKLNYAWQKDSLLLSAEKSFSAILPKDVSSSSIIINKTIPDHVDAPVKKGDVIGKATLKYADQTLATINLVASESVERSELLHMTDVVKSIFTSIWFLIIAALIILLVVIYIILTLIYNRKKKNMRKVKKYRKM
ncbi:D-alanyl-D-alanine carboxypeptidase DacF [Caprobacter fermentans]|uniref:serine-type D-Ala-D-Ala carboxypeptidase n=1 Tax=Caproicibacter fermentans TaxID=2576756 RepID=A0A6N8I024_9FIRM|nr:D-alanyl-D-alanine carboxypeptidase family protein [Caproicibacter fermentans]MVB11299.1 D-alanyl-D-alanine carboxypeptidase DacF [Caproicibacter fermentans]